MGDPLASAAALRTSVGAMRPPSEVQRLLNSVNSALEQSETIYTSGGTEHKALLHAAAIGHYQLGQYRDARARATELVELDPGDTSSRELKGMIEQAIDKDGKIGLAVVGGVLAAAAATVLVLFKRR